MHLDPSDETVRLLLERGITGPVVMLNLLRFRETANYKDHPVLAPLTPISGREAYERYMAHTMPFLTASGGSVDFAGDGGHFFVGPDEERWDPSHTRAPGEHRVLLRIRVERRLPGGRRSPQRRPGGLAHPPPGTALFWVMIGARPVGNDDGGTLTRSD
jgi:hypothetical protein